MIQEKEYASRRTRLANSLKSDSVGIIWSSEYATRSNDTEYPYRQNSNFYYLTGFKEDKSCLMIVKKKKKYTTILFVEKKDPAKELWTGRRLGVKQAKKMFDVDEVYTFELLEKVLKKKTSQSRYIYCDTKVISLKEKISMKLCKHMKQKNIASLIGNMRLYKSDAEIRLIKKAIAITKKAHHQAIKMKKLDTNEYELHAKIDYVFKKNGAYSDAYTSIVAGGNSANTLHYIENNQPLVKGDLILIDAGCEYEYYASDITRTIPVDGHFSKAQKELYEMVLDVQLKIIAMIQPTILRSTLQKKSEELLCDGMIALGILKGTRKKCMKKKLHKKYYPHGIGHWMGIDVHDEAPYTNTKNKEIPLDVGMVLTIEPGIYCNADDTSIPKKYRGIGIRIEDDILVTQNGYENLSASIAKSIQEVEKLSNS